MSVSSSNSTSGSANPMPAAENVACTVVERVRSDTVRP